MSRFDRDRKFSDKFIPQVSTIIGPLLLEPSDFKRDAMQATDLIVLAARDMRIGVRIRRHKYAAAYRWEFTIRSRLDSGAETEFAKIKDGWGDWLFYGITDEGEGYVDRWMLVDLHKFRATLIDRWPIRWGEKANGDGSYFHWYDIRSFPARVVVKASFDLPAAKPSILPPPRVAPSQAIKPRHWVNGHAQGRLFDPADDDGDYRF